MSFNGGTISFIQGDDHTLRIGIMPNQRLIGTLPEINVRYRLPFQPVNATHALNFSAGVSNCNVFLGRSFS